jgi:hypothetical protein
MSKRISLKFTDKNDWLIEAIQAEMDISNRPSLNNVVENILVSYFKSSEYMRLKYERRKKELESKLNKDYWFSWDYNSDDIIVHDNREFQVDRKVAWRGDILLYNGLSSIENLMIALDLNTLREIPKPKDAINDSIDYVKSETPFIESKKL